MFMSEKHINNLIQRDTVSKCLTSKFPINYLGKIQKFHNENGSRNEDSLTAKDDKIGTENLGNLYVGVPMTDRIGRNLEQPLTGDLLTLGDRYRIPGWDPLG